MNTCYLFGALRVTVSPDGAILSTLCAVDGAPAEGRFRPAYILQAVHWALRQHAATYTEG